MKKFVGVILILLLVAVGCIAFGACDVEGENVKPMRLYDGMRTEEIFDVLERVNSYTIKAGDEDYRFTRDRGYTKLEEGIYDALVLENGKGVRYHKEPNGIVQKSEVAVDEEFYDEINDVYDRYIELLRDSFEDMESRDPAKFELGANGYKATIKLIVKKGEGDLVVFTCEISNLNSTELFFPDED